LTIREKDLNVISRSFRIYGIYSINRFDIFLSIIVQKSETIEKKSRIKEANVPGSSTLTERRSFPFVLKSMAQMPFLCRPRIIDTV
jgi:hypothetical protein